MSLFQKCTASLPAKTLARAAAPGSSGGSFVGAGFGAQRSAVAVLPSLPSAGANALMPLTGAPAPSLVTLAVPMAAAFVPGVSALTPTPAGAVVSVHGAGIFAPALARPIAAAAKEFPGTRTPDALLPIVEPLGPAVDDAKIEKALDSIFDGRTSRPSLIEEGVSASAASLHSSGGTRLEGPTPQRGVAAQVPVAAARDGVPIESSRTESAARGAAIAGGVALGAAFTFGSVGLGAPFYLALGAAAVAGLAAAAHGYLSRNSVAISAATSGAVAQAPGTYSFAAALKPAFLTRELHHDLAYEGVAFGLFVGALIGLTLTAGAVMSSVFAVAFLSAPLPAAALFPAVMLLSIAAVPLAIAACVAAVLVRAVGGVPQSFRNAVAGAMRSARSLFKRHPFLSGAAALAAAVGLLVSPLGMASLLFVDGFIARLSTYGLAHQGAIIAIFTLLMAAPLFVEKLIVRPSRAKEKGGQTSGNSVESERKE